MNTCIKALHIKWFSIWLIVLLPLPSTSIADKLFDTHLHYNAADVEHFSPQQIINLLDKNSIQHALVTGRPTELAMRLHRHAPTRILPLLGAYNTLQDKETWTADKNLPSRLEYQLKQNHWRGIGELHLFAEDRHSPVFKEVIKLAQQYKLPLLLHTDPAVIDTVYEQAPEQPIIWAHAGTFPYPDLIADYLTRYPALHIDLTVRDERIAPGGIIRDDWYDLFVNHPDRFMIGVDTYSVSRWKNFDNAVTRIRQWIKQLPPDVANALMYCNAADLFAISNYINNRNDE